jgi:hypothetical protein
MTELEMAVNIYERALEQTKGSNARAVAEVGELADRGDLDEITRRTAALLRKPVAEVVASRERQMAADARRRFTGGGGGLAWVAVLVGGLAAAVFALSCLGGLAFYFVGRSAVRPPMPPPARVATVAAGAPMAGGVLPDPGNLTAYQGQVGLTVDFQVTGAANGPLWGTDVYTTDSSLAMAAVHAGVLRMGETGVVRVLLVAPPPAFQGSTRNGVTSFPWDAYPSAFKVSRPVAAPAAGGPAAGGPAAPAVGGLPPPGDLTGLQGQVGQAFDFQVTGTADGSVWGTDVYTTDSSLAKAAVHAGVLKVGETGVVRVRIVAPRPAYQGSTRNGVVSDSWGAWPGAFTVARAPAAAAADPAAPAAPAPDPGNLTAYQGQVGQTLYFRVTGSRDGSLWGTDVYTTDSALATAAVHAGVLREGQTGTVKVKIVPPPPAFQGSTRNGVTSGDWEAYPSAFQVSRP